MVWFNKNESESWVLFTKLLSGPIGSLGQVVEYWNHG